MGGVWKTTGCGHQVENEDEAQLRDHVDVGKPPRALAL
jgi:hypothetical protein